jgi:hypothetical protein
MQMSIRAGAWLKLAFIGLEAQYAQRAVAS